MNTAKTLVAALAFSLVGITAAQACTATITFDNQSDYRIMLDGVSTQKKGSNKWVGNVTGFIPVMAYPRSVATKPLSTMRKKNTEFRLRVNFSYRLTKAFAVDTNYARCADGFTVTIPASWTP